MYYYYVLLLLATRIIELNGYVLLVVLLWFSLGLMEIQRQESSKQMKRELKEVHERVNQSLGSTFWEKRGPLGLLQRCGCRCVAGVAVATSLFDRSLVKYVELYDVLGDFVQVMQRQLFQFFSPICGIEQ